MSEFFDLPSLILAVGNYAERPAAPLSSAYAYFARDTRQLFIADLNLTWRDVGLYRYTVIDIPTDVLAGTQISWSQSVTVSGNGALTMSGDGAIYVIG